MAIILGLLGIFLFVSVIGGGYDIMVLVFSPDRPIDGYFMKIAAYVLDRLGFLGAFLPFFAVMYVITFIVAASFLDYDSDKDHEEMGEIMGIPLGAVIIGSFEYFAFANFLIDTPFGAFTSGAAGAWVFSNASTTHQWIAAVVCTICLPGSILFMLFKMLQVSGVLRKTLFLFFDICNFIKEKLPKTKKQLEQEATMRKAEEERQERIREEIRRRDEEKIREQEYIRRRIEEEKKYEEEQKWLREVEERKKPKEIDGSWYGQSFGDVLAGRIPVDSYDGSHETALMFAARQGDVAGVKKLISMGANVNARDNSEKTPLLFATKSGTAAAERNLLDIVQALINAGAVVDVEDDGKTALSYCFERGQFATAYWLMARMKHFSENAVCEILRAAALHKDTFFLALLLKSLPANAKGHDGGNALFHCAWDIPPEAARLLIKAGADVNQIDEDGHNCLWDQNRADTIKILLEAGADPNVGMSWRGYREPAALEALIEAGAYVNDINEKGRTALIENLETDSPDKKDIAIVYLLLKAGAKPNTKLVKQEDEDDDDFETALDFALWLPRWGEHWYETSELILRMLLKKGAKPKNDIRPEQKTYIQKALNKNRESDPMKEAKEIFEELKEKEEKEKRWEEIEKEKDIKIQKEFLNKLSQKLRDSCCNLVFGSEQTFTKNSETGCYVTENLFTIYTFLEYALSNIENFAPLFFFGGSQTKLSALARLCLRTGLRCACGDMTGTLKEEFGAVNGKGQTIYFLNRLYLQLRAGEAISFEPALYLLDGISIKEDTIIPLDDLPWFFTAARQKGFLFIVTTTEAEIVNMLFKQVNCLCMEHNLLEDPDRSLIESDYPEITDKNPIIVMLNEKCSEEFDPNVLNEDIEEGKQRWKDSLKGIGIHVQEIDEEDFEKYFKSYDDDTSDEEEESEDDSEYEDDDADDDNEFDDEDEDEDDSEYEDDDSDEDDDVDEEDDEEPVKKAGKNFSFAEMTKWFDAAKHDRPEIIKKMIAQGVDIEAENEDGETALYLACDWEKPEVVSLLLKAGANINIKGKYKDSLFYEACESGNEDIVSMLVKAGADVNSKNRYKNPALFAACENGNSEIVSLLIKAGANINLKNEDGETALKCFCKNEDIEDTEIVSVLINAGAEVNIADSNGVTPLMAVMRNSGNKETLKLLLDAGADVEAKDEDGDTVLQYAFDVDCARLLIKAGADIYTKNNNNETLLMNACSAEYAQFLIDKGLDVNAVDDDGNTPLTTCVSCRFKDDPEGELDTLQVLLKAGANADAADNDSDTALMILADLSRLKRPIEFTKKAIKALLDAGANPLKENKKGKSALSIAEKAGNAEVIKMLTK